MNSVLSVWHVIQFPDRRKKGSFCTLHIICFLSYWRLYKVICVIPLFFVTHCVYIFSRNAANAELVFSTVFLIQNRCFWDFFMKFRFCALCKIVAEIPRIRGKSEASNKAAPGSLERQTGNRGTKTTDL